jgi:hypothetical protein
MPYATKQPPEHKTSADELLPSSGTMHGTTHGTGKVRRLQATSNWVAVAHRKPASSGHYLVLLRGKRHRLMEYEAENLGFSPKSLNLVVTHWMPLPELPAQ